MPAPTPAPVALTCAGCEQPIVGPDLNVFHTVNDTAASTLNVAPGEYHEEHCPLPECRG